MSIAASGRWPRAASWPTWGQQPEALVPVRCVVSDSVRSAIEPELAKAPRAEKCSWLTLPIQLYFEALLIPLRETWPRVAMRLRRLMVLAFSDSGTSPRIRTRREHLHERRWGRRTTCLRP